MNRGLTALVSILLPLSAALACSARDPSSSNLVQNSHGGTSGSKGSGGAGGSSFGADGPGVIIGGITGSEPGGVAKALVFDPATITLVVDDAAATHTAEFSLLATVDGGQMAKVSAEALEFDRPDLASSKNGSPVVLTATGAVAGKGTLHAVYGGFEATAELNVELVEKHVDGAVPADVITALDAGGAQDATLTSLLYPYDKTVFALGLQSPQFMWTGPNLTGDTYRLHVEQAGYKFDLYSAAAGGKLAIPQATWDRVTSSNTGDPMVVTLYRYDGLAQAAYSSATVSFTIAPESLRGAIYYWTASRANAGVGNITRIYPGVGAMPESLGTGKCMGCHSVSADGSTMVVDIEGVPTMPPYQEGYGNTRPWAAFALPAATLTNQTSAYGAGPALTPDGKYVVFGNGKANPPQPGSKNFSLAVTANGMVIADSGLDDIVFSAPGLNLMMPSFSLDGTKLVAVEAAGDAGHIRENVIPDPAKRIVYMDFDASVPKFDPTLHEIVNVSQFQAGNQAFGYPAFTPTNDFIAYHTGLYSTGCNPNGCGDDTPDGGEIWMSPVAGGAPIRLTALNDPPNAKDHFANREPTFCPVQRGGYSWMVFTSMRDWGNELTAVAPNTNAKRRLWVAAIDNEVGTVDPSHPAFYIEGQENTPNMRGFWALSECIQTPPPGETGMMCKSNFECCSGFCVEDVCVDRTTLSCAGINEACAIAADCCNSTLVSCINNKCKVAEPPK